MKHVVRCMWILIASWIFISGAKAGDGDIRVLVEDFDHPLFINAPPKPLVRIRIAIAETKKEAVLSALSFQWGDEQTRGSSATLYYTGNEPIFSDAQPVAADNAGGKAIRLSMKQTLSPGIHFFWVTAELAKGFSMDKLLSIKDIQVLSMEGTVWYKSPVGQIFSARLASMVVKAGQGGIHTFRIPGIVSTRQGTLLAVYDLRYKNAADLPGNIDVGLSRSTDGGMSWEDIRVIMDMGPPHENNGVGDPAILYDSSTNTIWVAALWSKGNRSIAGSEPGLSPDTSGQIVLVSSSDDGRTWSAPYNITSQVKDPKWHLYFCGPGAGIVMKDGTLVFAAQYWDETAKPGMPHSSIIYSRDKGKTWTSGKGVRSNTNEAQVIETVPGTLMINMRDNRGGSRSVATSRDMGNTWTLHANSYSVFRDPVCMASFAKFNMHVKGKQVPVVFFSNVDDAHNRVNTTVRASLDFGETWLPQHQLLVDERRTYGYSCLVKIDDHTIGMLYEGRGDLFFVRIPVKHLIK